MKYVHQEKLGIFFTISMQATYFKHKLHFYLKLHIYFEKRMNAF